MLPYIAMIRTLSTEKNERMSVFVSVSEESSKLFREFRLSP